MITEVCPISSEISLSQIQKSEKSAVEYRTCQAFIFKSEKRPVKSGICPAVDVQNI